MSVKLRCVLTVLVLGLTFEETIEKDATTYYIDENAFRSGECIKGIIDFKGKYDEHNITLSSVAPFSDAWCTNFRTDGLILFHKSIDSKSVATVLQAHEKYEGKWQCSFIRDTANHTAVKNIYLKEKNESSIDLLRCSFEIRFNELLRETTREKQRYVNLWAGVPVGLIVICLVIIGAIIHLMSKAKKTEENEHIYESVDYGTVGQQQPSTPPIETAASMGLTRDSAYTPMALGETPSVVHYLHPGKLLTTPRQERPNHVLSDPEMYLTMSPDSPPAGSKPPG